MSRLTQLQYYMEQFESEDDIAARCRSLGVKGYVGRCYECAFSNLVKKELGFADITVTRSKVGFDDRETYPLPEDWGRTVQIPLPVWKFTLRFDEGKYQDLLAPPEPL